MTKEALAWLSRPTSGRPVLPHTQAYNTTTCHLIDNDWTMKAYVLGTNAFPGHHHTGVRIAELLEQMMSDLDAPSDQVHALVHGQAANFELAGRILFGSSSSASEVCACHRLQNCLQSAVEGVPAFEKLLPTGPVPKNRWPFQAQCFGHRPVDKDSSRLVHEGFEACTRRRQKVE